jgi:hypothetical protein
MTVMSGEYHGIELVWRTVGLGSGWSQTSDHIQRDVLLLVAAVQGLWLIVLQEFRFRRACAHTRSGILNFGATSLMFGCLLSSYQHQEAATS